MSEKLPSREQALQLLRDAGCGANVVRHAEAVASLTLEIGRICKARGSKIDLTLVETGALLHDIGRSKTHSVDHAIVGAEIAKSLGLPEPIISIIKRHVGGGITTKEAKELKWPKDVYVPETVEEKIVSYADKLIEGSKRVPIERTIKELSAELPPSAIERIWKLHEEILSLVGDSRCLP